jgi:hypothetical protein
MSRNPMNTPWLRPIFALLAFAGLLALGGCGGGSGAPNNPFAPVTPAPGPLFVLPPAATVYSHTPATLTVSGGLAPYSAFSSNATIMPVAQSVNGSTVVLLANDVSADVTTVITIKDAIGQTATSTVTVRAAPIFNTLTITPARTACGTNTVCSGETATASVTVTGAGGAGIPNRAVRFDVVSGAFAIQSSNPAQPLVATLTTVSDANGKAQVILQAAVNVATQPAVLRATEVATGNSITGTFTIVQSTDGAAILSVVPPTATINGADTASCTSGFRVDYFIYGGTPPYRVSSTFPTAVTLINSVVNTAGGSFSAITNGACVNPLVFTIVDATGRQITAQLINIPGTAAPPTPPTPPTVPALVISPATQAVTSCFGKTVHFLVTGGTAPYSIAVITPPASASVSSGDVSVSGFSSGASTITVVVVDQSSPQKTVTGTVTCT